MAQDLMLPAKQSICVKLASATTLLFFEIIQQLVEEAHRYYKKYLDMLNVMPLCLV
jgi:hypothetical protein